MILQKSFMIMNFALEVAPENTGTFVLVIQAVASMIGWITMAGS